MLAAAEQEYDQQQVLTALAVAEAGRLAPRGSPTIAGLVQVYQAAAIELAQSWMGPTLAEQGITSAPTADLVPASLLTDTRQMVDMLDTTNTQAAFDRILETFITDAARTARAVESVTEPEVTAHIRSLRLPSCARCVILAGRIYRWSDGFQRHPLCDCLMTPTNETAGKHLVTDATDALDKGMVTGLSRGDTTAVAEGADLSRVVNVKRQAAGLTVGTSVLERRGRLTPQGCLSAARGDREAAIRLLTEQGYIH